MSKTHWQRSAFCLYAAVALFAWLPCAGCTGVNPGSTDSGDGNEAITNDGNSGDASTDPDENGGTNTGSDSPGPDEPGTDTTVSDDPTPGGDGTDTDSTEDGQSTDDTGNSGEDPGDVTENDPRVGEEENPESSGKDDEIPGNEYCADAADWDDSWAAFEEEVLELVNVRRGQGADCGSAGTFSPAGPLAMNGALRCAARIHSADMGENDFFSHTNLADQGPGDRVDLAEYVWSTWGENIAWGQTSPAQVVDGWMNSDGHCSNIMNASFTEIGIGYYEGNFWTQVFGAPR
ncbi:MAG: CAP domain-containing protein [Planctomycetota bacterium]|jgi:uncharacterized protein YkwD